MKFNSLVLVFSFASFFFLPQTQKKKPSKKQQTKTSEKALTKNTAFLFFTFSPQSSIIKQQQCIYCYYFVFCSYSLQQSLRLQSLSKLNR